MKLSAHLFVLVLAFLTGTAQAQLERLKAFLRTNVRIIEETGERMVLSHTQRGDSLRVTLDEDAQSDIYSIIRQERGRNPYRIWTISSRLTRRYSNPAVELLEYFEPEFLSTLEMTERSSDPEAENLKEQPGELVSGSQMADKEPRVTSFQVASDLYQQGRNLEQQGRLREALATYHSLAEIAPGFRDTEERIRSIDTSLGPKPRSNIEAEYDRGVAALSARNWGEALGAFTRVVNMNPDYRDATQKLMEANQAWVENPEPDQPSANDSSEPEAPEEWYFEGIRAIQEENFGKAAGALRKVREVDPDYKNTESLYRHVIEMMRLQSSQATLSPANARKEMMLDSLYHAGLSEKFNGNLAQALMAFRKIQNIEPNFRNVSAEIADLGELIREEKEQMSEVSALPVGEEQYNKVRVSSAASLRMALAAALVLIPALGVLFFYPPNRARIALITGNRERACLIYEGMLVKNPHRLKVYSKIAGIYLMSNRSDEKAIRIYQQVIDLGLAVKNDYGKLFSLLQDYNDKQLTEPLMNDDHDSGSV